KDDADARMAMAAALAAQGKYDAALPQAERYAALRPTDLAGQAQLLQILVKKGAPAADGGKRYQALKAAHAGDRRFELMVGIAQRYANDAGAALASFRAAAGTGTAAGNGDAGQDAQFITMLAQQFDAMSVPEEADAVIERSAARSQDPAV